MTYEEFFSAVDQYFVNHLDAKFWSELPVESRHAAVNMAVDDVLSELDSNRQNYLLNSINNIQTLITCTGLDEFINNRFHINKIFHVEEGTVSTEN